MNLKQHILVFFLFFYSGLFSQVIISGNVKNQLKQPIEGLSVTIDRENTGQTIAFAITNNAGFFSIKVNDTAKKVIITIRGLGYSLYREYTLNTNSKKDYFLNQSPVTLREIFINAPQIRKRGDTIEYNVQSYSAQNDRSIADVLRKIPGIEVMPDGRILYQGTSINKYYIEGLDMLGGQYNMANQNISFKDVDKVQVIENHQPIKILDSISFSSKAAINLKLKKRYTLAVPVSFGIGVTPLLFSANITPMVFSPKEQMLSSYQSNNVGDNLQLQFKSLTIEDLAEQNIKQHERKTWLGIEQVLIPSISENRWLRNNIHIVSSNYLKRIKKNEFRINAAYYNDQQVQNGSTVTTYYLNTDTIQYYENKNNHLQQQFLQLKAVFENNTKDRFLKNNLLLEHYWDNQYAATKLGNSPIDQKLTLPFSKIDNNIKIITKLGRKLFAIHSNIGISSTSQSLIVKPGQFEQLLNNGDDYERLSQDVFFSNKYARNSIGIVKGLGTLRFTATAAFDVERQIMRSTIDVNNNKADSVFQNSLSWLRSKAFVTTKFEYEKNGWRFSLNFPLSKHNYQLYDNIFRIKQKLLRITIEPDIFIIKDLSPYLRWINTASGNNSFGTINDINFGYILRNYRTIQVSNAPLLQVWDKTFSTGFQYRNILKSVFATITYTAIYSKNNLLIENIITPQGISELSFVERDNRKSTHSIISTFNKHISRAKTTISFAMNYQISIFDQIINQKTGKIKNKNFQLRVKAFTDLCAWLSIELAPSVQIFENTTFQSKNPSISQYLYYWNVHFYINPQHYAGLKNEWAVNNLTSGHGNNFFTDFVYRYTLKNKKTEFTIQVNNIFNINDFRVLNINQFGYFQSESWLRSRYFFLKIRTSL